MTTNATEREALLPCPMCGCEAYCSDYREEVARVKCLDSSCGVEVFGTTKRTATDRWNRRASAERASAEKDAARYRWLKSNLDHSITHNFHMLDEDEFENWIDAAMNAEPTK